MNGPGQFLQGRGLLPARGSWPTLLFEIWVAVCLAVAYYFVTEQYAMGYKNIPGNYVTFTVGSNNQNFPIESIDEAWKGRLSGLLLAGYVVDHTTDPGLGFIDAQAFSRAFGIYHAAWLLLLFLAVIAALRNSLLVNLGIFAGLIYNFSPAAGMRAYPWDIPATFFFTLAVLLFERRCIGLMLAAIFMGFFFKETVLLCAILLFFNRSWSWKKNILVFVALVAACLLGKHGLIRGLHLDTQTLAMGESTNATGLIANAWRILKLNFGKIFSLQANHVAFASAGTLLAVLLFDWRTRKYWPYKLLIVLFVIGQLLYGLINEFRIFMEVLPLSWILLLQFWERRPATAAVVPAKGAPEPIWPSRPKTGALIALMAVTLLPLAGVITRQYTLAMNARDPQHTGQYLAVLEHWAKNGNPQAQYNLAVKYRDGDGVAKDLDKAFYWFTQAAERKHVAAEFTLGTIYLNGVGQPVNLTEGVRWFRQGANQGDVDCQRALAYCYQKGIGVNTDLDQAVQFYRNAADQGDIQSERFLGMVYAEEKKDYLQAIQWFKKAADQGDAPAQDDLGILYYQGFGVQVDTNQAIQWFDAAAKQNYSKGLYDMGNACLLAHNKADAVQYWLKAAGQGLVQAEYTLGTYYEDPSNGPVDYAKAVMWHAKAAMRGLPAAQGCLGELYLQGKGVAADPVEAYKWLKIAQVKGDPQAAAELPQAAAVMTKQQVAAAETLVKQMLDSPPKGMVSPDQLIP